MPGKVDNGDFEAKLLVRQTALELATPKPRVLDCYAGEGHMYQRAWSHAASRYLGMDERFSRLRGNPAGECWRGTNTILIPAAMALEAWDVVDLDAYSSPWPQLRQVLRLARVDHLVVTATCGMDRAIRVGSSDFSAAVAGASKLSYTGLLTRWYEDVIRWALAWATSGTAYRMARAQVIRGIFNQQMRYWLLEFRAETAPEASR